MVEGVHSESVGSSSSPHVGGARMLGRCRLAIRAKVPKRRCIFGCNCGKASTELEGMPNDSEIGS